MLIATHAVPAKSQLPNLKEMLIHNKPKLPTCLGTELKVEHVPSSTFITFTNDAAWDITFTISAHVTLQTQTLPTGAKFLTQAVLHHPEMTIISCSTSMPTEVC